jgi:hypothetical protein
MHACMHACNVQRCASRARNHHVKQHARDMHKVYISQIFVEMSSRNLLEESF